MAVIPYVIETTPRGELGMDIYSRLLRERIVFVAAPIDDHLATTVVAQLLLLRAEDPDRDIEMYVNSPGGTVHASLAIYDAMQQIQAGAAAVPGATGGIGGKARIHTVCYGVAASYAAVLLAAGARGARHALPHATIMIHQPPMQGSGGQASDFEIGAREVLRLRSRLNDILARHTGQPLERIQRDTDRDYFMTAQQARDYGLIDDVITGAHTAPDVIPRALLEADRAA